MKLVSDDEIRQFAKDNDLVFTDNPMCAIYLMRDGSLIFGEYSPDEPDVRYSDHRCMLDIIPEGNDYYTSEKAQREFWPAFHQKTGMIRLCPESSKALKATSQKITPEQQAVLAQANYEIENYV